MSIEKVFHLPFFTQPQNARKLFCAQIKHRKYVEFYINATWWLFFDEKREEKKKRWGGFYGETEN